MTTLTKTMTKKYHDILGEQENNDIDSFEVTSMLVN